MKIICDCGNEAFQANLRLPREPGAIQVTRSIGLWITFKKRDVPQLPTGPYFSVTCPSPGCGRELIVVELTS